MERRVQLRWLILLVAVFLGVMALHVPPTRGQVTIYGESTATVYAPAPSAENFAVPKNTTVSLGVSATANPNPPPLYNSEASMGGVTWTFTWVNAKVLATDPGSSYDWSAVSAADSGTYEKSLTTQTSSTGVINFNFTPKAQGYWHVTVSASATWTEYKDGNLVATHKTYVANSPPTGVTMIAVTPTVLVWNDGVEDWDDEAEIAAGCIDSPAHRTDVMITVLPAVAAKVPVTMTGGTGHPDDEDPNITNNAVLTFPESEGLDGAEIGPGLTVPIFTDVDGARIGALLSSNIYTEDANGHPTSSVAISGGGSSPATVYFGWSTNDWNLEPSCIVPGGSAEVWLRMTHNMYPLDGHTIQFFVERVEYVDENDVPQTPLENTPSDPNDLSAWASFATYEGAVGQEYDGWIHMTINFENVCEYATWIGIRAYDMSVYNQP
jgi:hypothetical protein